MASLGKNIQGEHSAILLTFIKLPFVIKIFVLSIFEWPFYTGFTVLLFPHTSGTMRRYTSKKYNYAPTLGVKSDFEALLQKFTETGTVRFQNFAEIWKEMKFSMYCAGRQTQREVREVR